MQLVPCGGCRRHVDVREVACPFCASPIVAARSQWFAPRGRITRAAVFSAALVACESKHDAPKPVPAPQQQGSDDLETMLDTDHRVVDHPALPADASVAIDGAAVATATDAGVPVDAGIDQARLKAEQDRRRQELLERRRKKMIEQNKVVVPVDPDRNYHNIPKPYGAPPARRRIV